MICNSPEVFEALISSAATKHEVLQVRAGDGGEEDDPMELYASPSQGDPSAPVAGGSASAPAGRGAQGKGRGKKAAGDKKQKTEQVSAVSPDLCQEMHQLMCRRRGELSLPQLGEGTREEQAEAVAVAVAGLWSRPPKQAFISALLR